MASNVAASVAMCTASGPNHAVRSSSGSSCQKARHTNHRVGFDAIIGLVPGIGDAVSTLLSSYIIWEARQLGLPRWKIARMVANVATDTVLGAIPLAGDVFDVFFRANRRNMRIVRDHLERTGSLPRTIEGRAVRID
jgi:hypothetical protein